MTAEIALLAEALDAARGGGAEVAVRAIARALRSQGARVALYAPCDRLGPPEEGIPTVGVPLRRGRGSRRVVETARAVGERARRDGAQVLVACGKILGADVVWVHGGVHAAARAASVAAGRGRIGRAFARAGRFFRPSEHAIDDVERELYLACREGRSRAVALSERTRRDLEPFLGAESAAKVPVVRNGIELERFARRSVSSARPELRRALEAGAGDAIGLFVAHRFALKGLDALLRALPRVRRLRVAVVGRDDPGPFARLARRLGVPSRVAFLGERSDTERLYDAADLVVHPSRYDPCSLVVLEALAAGRPIVASRKDGASELLRDGASGLVVDDPDDTAALAARLARASEDEALRGKLAEGARAGARPVEACARELLALLRAAPARATP